MNLRYTILQAVAKNPICTLAEIAAEIDYDRQKIKFSVSDCVKGGLLTRQRDDVTGLPGYVLTQAGRDRLAAGPQKCQPQSANAQPAVACSNTGSNGSGSPSEHHLLPEAVAVPQKTATEALASPPPEPPVAADVNEDDGAMLEPHPVLLVAAKLHAMLTDRLEGVAHALRGSGLPGLAEVTGREDLQPHVATLTEAYRMERGATLGRVLEIDGAAVELAAALKTVTGIEAKVIDGMCLKALAKTVAGELRNLRALADKLQTLLDSKTHELEALRAHQPKTSGLCATQIDSFVMLASKRKPRRITKIDNARAAAVSAIRAGAQRADVFALVPIGRAVRGAEWRDA